MSDNLNDLRDEIFARLDRIEAANGKRLDQMEAANGKRFDRIEANQDKQGEQITATREGIASLRAINGIVAIGVSAVTGTLTSIFARRL